MHGAVKTPFPGGERHFSGTLECLEQEVRGTENIFLLTFWLRRARQKAEQKEDSFL